MLWISIMTSIKARPSAYGALAYIANFYGIKSAKELLLRIDITAPHSPKDYDAHLVNKVLRNDIVARDVKHHMHALPTSAFRENRQHSMPFLQSKRFRSCKQCLAEGTLHQAHWQDFYYTHCHTHSTQLSDACEHIYANQFWMPCKQCEPGNEKTAIPAYLQHCLCLESQIQVEVFIGQLTILAERMHRPFDYIAVKLPWDRLTVEKVSNILNDAFLLGALDKTNDVWSTCIRKKRAKLNVKWQEAEHYGLDTLETTLKECDWSLSENINVTTQTILNKYHDGLNQLNYRNRNHIYDDDTPDSVSLRASNSVIARMLNVKTDALRELIDSGKLPVMKDSGRGDKLIFDVADVSKAMNDIQSWSIWVFCDFFMAPGLRPEVLRTLLLDRKQLNKHLISGNFGATWTQLDNEATLSSATIYEFANIVSAIYEFELNHAEHLSIKSTADFLGVTECNVVFLVQQGFLQWARWQRSCNQFINIKSVKSFVSDYLVVNREAILKGVETSELISSIRDCCGCSTTIEHVSSPSNSSMVIYDKAKLNDCCRKVATNKLEVLFSFCIPVMKNNAQY